MSAAIASCAARLISAGAGKSGKPCDKLTAPYSKAWRVMSRITDSVKWATLELRRDFCWMAVSAIRRQPSTFGKSAVGQPPWALPSSATRQRNCLAGFRVCVRDALSPPPGAACTHGLRRGLHSCAALRLHSGSFFHGTIKIDLRTPTPRAYRVTGARTLAANKKLLLIHFCRHCQIKESDHHLLIRLIAPCNRCIRVGVMRIVARVVIPRHRSQFGSGLQ